MNIGEFFDLSMVHAVIPAAIIAAVLIAVNGVQQAIYTVQLVMAGVALAKRSMVEAEGALWWLYSDVILPVSLIMPALNEELTIVKAVQSILDLHYPLFELVVVNDGSTDNTLALLTEAFKLEPADRLRDEVLDHAPTRGLYYSATHPRLVVLDKENGGCKADALNAGINIARRPLVAALDADSLLEPDSLLRVVQPFLTDPERTVAVGGTIRVLNDCIVERGRVTDVRLPKKLLARFQVVEYLRAFLMGRLGWSQMKALPLVSGAFGVFRRSVLLEIGGYDKDSMGEDYELIIRLHRTMCDNGKPYAIHFVPEPVCWTQVPENWRSLANQRIRWQRGAMETVFKHIDMIWKPRYGRVGVLSLGITLLVDVLGPIAELLGYLLIPLFWWLGWLNADYFIAFTALIFGYGVFLSVGSLVLEELELKRVPRIKDLLNLAGVAIIENFGYRQINNLFRIIGFWQFVTGKKSVWVPIDRTEIG